jgi:hypothetical protein
MKPLPLAALLLLAATEAAAAPVKCVDAKGHVRYIDDSMMAQEQCQPVSASTNIVPAQPGAINAPQESSRGPAGARGTPAAPPSAAQQEADRRAAIADAEARLAAAKKTLADQEATREGSEKNYARVQERLKPYQDAVDQAQKDLDAARAAR